MSSFTLSPTRTGTKKSAAKGQRSPYSKPSTKNKIPTSELNDLTPLVDPKESQSVSRRAPTIDSIKRAIFERPKDWKTRVISMREVQKHNSPDDCWIVAKGKVFNATPFISIHPGGKTSILRRGGGTKDASVDYDFHSGAGRKIWTQYQIGILEGHESKCAIM
jgi:cytochrome b involved in lipid metabolism